MDYTIHLREKVDIIRIWHYRLIPVLPNAQLKAMRYEIGDMVKQYPNIKNGLVKYINNEDIQYLFNYFLRVLDEFDKRKINHKKSYDDEICKIIDEKSKNQFVSLNLFYQEHNDRYLKQCYYNLQEKFDRGIISKEEWLKIENKVQINNYNINTIDEFLNEDFSIKLPSVDEIEIIE